MHSLGKVLIAAPIHEVLSSGLEAQGYKLLWQPNITQQQGLQLIKECVGVVTSTRLQVNKELINAAPNLRFIARMGSGMEVIDVAYATQKNIRCISSPEGNCNAVAEHALGMLLSLSNNIFKSNTELKNGLWLREENRGSELENKTIAIIGYGHTGAAFAKLLSGFDVQILVYDKYKKIEPSAHYTVCKSLETIYREADIVSLHVPFQEDTIHLVNEFFFQQIKKPITLINTSRGTVVDVSKLAEYLDSGKLKGLVLDVWEQEPFDKMSSTSKAIFENLLQRNNVIITPHIAGYTHEALYKMSLILLKRIVQ